GANQAVLEMLSKIRDGDDDVATFVKKVKNREDNVKLMGFGHRVYRAEDPRARVLRATAKRLDAPRYEVAAALEQAA
ncbi:citrate (Si)-synthase, partial [Mycobacterium sp. ITM-2017-0098]